ncbi:MAG TPA: purine-nucleoside phosphorylase [Deltaproteobacteria bacterium]|nr:purine-nucleoside phosphorylase [Deltaproteobacteria bacterium]
MSQGEERAAAAKLSSIGSADTAIILGTGLDIMEQEISIDESIDYKDIPGFPTSSVESHRGRLLFGHIGGYPVVVMSGRFHLYEGYSAKEVTYPIRVFSHMGIKRIFISNAAGGLKPDLTPGRAMLITDHINLTGNNPLTGPNDDTLGPRFPDMTRPYCPSLMERARIYAKENGNDLAEGVYVQVPGPSMETAAETRMLQRIGADAVGMSTVMEVIQAAHCGMHCLAISAITNNNDPDNYLSAPIEEVIAMARKAGPLIAHIFRGVLKG